MILTMSTPSLPQSSLSVSSLRLGAEARNCDLKIRYAFADSSVVAGATPATIWINVGTQKAGGIVNFRAPGSGVRGSCECVIQMQSDLFAHIFTQPPPANAHASAASVLEVTVVMSREWKPDDAAAAWLIEELLRKGQLPAHARELAANMALSRQSALTFRPRARHKDATMMPGNEFLDQVLAPGGPPKELGIPLYTAMLCRLRALQYDGNDEEARSAARREQLKALMALTCHACMAIAGKARAEPTMVVTPQDFDMSSVPQWTRDMEQPVIVDVIEAFQSLPGHRSLTTARFPMQLPLGDSMQEKWLVECLAVQLPQSRTKFDPVIQPALTSGVIDFGDGPSVPKVVMMWRNIEDARKFDIFLAVQDHSTTDRDTPSLRRLGIVLEEREQRARDSNGKRRDPRRTMQGRFLDIPGIDDPWYDGRDHDYAIAGAPRAGSVLTFDEVKETMESEFWKPMLNSSRAWSISRLNDNATRKSLEGEATSGGYRPRQLAIEAGGAETWTYVEHGKSSLLRTPSFTIDRLNASTDGQGRASLELFGLQNHPDGLFRVLILDLAPPPFAAKARVAQVADCVSEVVRDEFRRAICGPASASIEIDADRVADIGANGLVIWCRPGRKPSSQEDGIDVVRATMDVLAYQADLANLMGSAADLRVDEGMLRTFFQRWQHGQSPSTYLLRFSDIVKSFRPEGQGADLGRICDALEDALSAEATVMRLERFLQFSDERERILRDGILQVIAALLALPVLVQTSADLIQAWDVWKRTTALGGEGTQGALPGPVDFWGGSESFAWWVLRQGALMGMSVLVLAAALYLLGKSGRWAVLNRAYCRTRTIFPHF